MWFISYIMMYSININIKHCSIYNMVLWFSSILGFFSNTRVVYGLISTAVRPPGLLLAKAMKYFTVSMATLVSGGLRLIFLAIKSWTVVHKSPAGLVVSLYLKGLALCFTAVVRLQDWHWITTKKKKKSTSFSCSVLSCEHTVKSGSKCERKKERKVKF